MPCVKQPAPCIRRQLPRGAARLLAWLRGEQARGNLLLAGFRESFRRHRAFQAELDAVMGSRAPAPSR